MENTLQTEKTGRQSKQAFWNRHIETWQQSGLTQVDYCQKHDLNKHTFLYWKAKWNKSEMTRPLLPVSILNEIHSTTSPVSSGISISISKGLEVTLDVGFDSETLSRLIDVLERR